MTSCIACEMKISKAEHLFDSSRLSGELVTMCLCMIFCMPCSLKY